MPRRDRYEPGTTATPLEAHARKLPMSALTQSLPARFTASDRLKDYPTERSRALIESLISGGAATMEQMFGALCGKLASVDTTDGLRMSFDSGEIVHLRPSGNAPEFRCYNEAGDEGRVVELNSLCLATLKSLAVS